MIPLTLISSRPRNPLSLKPCYLPALRPISTRHNHLKKLQQRRRLRDGACRAEFSGDAPVAVAIGACILNSLIFPVTPPPEDDESESLIDSTDTRLAVMGVISFIPYFNWLSWVFAWLDTGRQRYVVYTIVYLAPYLRSNLSLSPEESWLPIASIFLCIAHVQLETSIKNGDIQGFQLFNEVANRLTRNKNSSLSNEEQGRKDSNKLEEGYRNEIGDWIAPHKATEDLEMVSEDEETNGGAKH